MPPFYDPMVAKIIASAADRPAALAALKAGLGRTVRGLKVSADGIADYTERVVRRFLADRDAATDETFAQWAHRADEEALQ